MNKPNFIIAGEAKAGTTALYAYLSQHPEVFMCEPKEPRYFAFRERRPDFSGPMDEEWFNSTTVYKRDDYYKLFDGAEGEKAIGEASPIYMHIPGCAEAIAEELPDAKIIVIMRDPIELAFSAYKHMVRNGKENLSFGEALDAEGERIKQNWAWHWRYMQLGFVADNLQSFTQHFPRENLMVIRYEDFQKNNEATLKKLCDFLGIDSGFEFRPTKANVSAKPRIRWLRDLLMSRGHWVKRLLRPFIPYEMRKTITLTLAELNMKQASEGVAAAEKARLSKVYANDKLRCQKNLSDIAL